ncbi:RNA polymerase sigma factor [Alicyclobacillus acidiphilus]|uniref:RNA polymerase sigma factor n=1 Tax=Alicyclobacillus acidiphilus TaxID=182455 RepID=UPI00082C5C45|nr:RNA polymerase sigma factor [Alicyclobacillus acidiphilus]
MDDGAPSRLRGLLEVIQPLVYRLAYQFARHQQDAEDITQEVLYKICSKLSTYREDSSFHSWVYALVVNTFRDMYRKRVTASSQVLLEPVAVGQLFESAAIARMTLEQILESLDPESRMLLTLRFHSELTVREIAEAMNLTISNVKTRLFRIREKLQRSSRFGRGCSMVCDRVIDALCGQVRRSISMSSNMS